MKNLTAIIFKIWPHALQTHQQTLTIYASDSSSFWHKFIMNLPIWNQGMWSA
jgi:hypothetical protein